MSNYLLDFIIENTTTDVMLEPEEYQKVVVEYTEYFKSILHSLHTGMVNPRHITSMAQYGINRDMEMKSHMKVNNAIQGLRGVLNMEIVRCNPCLGLQIVNEGKVIISMLLLPEAFMDSINAAKVDYSSFTHGFMLYAY